MFSITEQFSAVTKSQLEAQFGIFNNLASKAVESAQKVLALNISTTKASVEKSSAAARQLLEAKDPQEFFSVSSQTPNFEHVFAYSRQLLSIASSAQAELLASARDRIGDGVPVVKALAGGVAQVRDAQQGVTQAVVHEVKQEVAQPAAKSQATPPVTPPVVAAGAASANEAIAAPAAAPKAAAKAIAKAKPATAPTPVAVAVTQLIEKPAAEHPAAAPVATPQVAVAVPPAVAAKPAAAAKPAPVVSKSAAPVPSVAVNKPAATAKPAAAPAPKSPAAKPGAVSFPTAKSVALKSVAAPIRNAAKPQQGKQLDMLGGGKSKK
ncbi:phasin family protein [Rugamonas sp.]|uniref:phasin family protein n=1 Tax=Rugamonas sp. TaxID=1926287 RepID=UPI0025D8A0EB|nr:phasin family protein [Rugamonas sp.]